MAEHAFEDDLVRIMRNLNDEQQRRVLEFEQNMINPIGISGKLAIQHAREIHFDAQDLLDMKQVIEDACEQIEDFPQIDLSSS